MPSSVVKSFAKRTGKSVDDVEKIWNAIRDSLLSSGHKETDDNFYPMLVGGLKKALKLKEGKMKNFKKFIEESHNMINVPNYRPEGTPEKGCNSSCKWWRPGTTANDGVGSENVCDQFGFLCDQTWVCDAWEAAVPSVDAPGA